MRKWAYTAITFLLLIYGATVTWLLVDVGGERDKARQDVTKLTSQLATAQKEVTRLDEVRRSLIDAQRIVVQSAQDPAYMGVLKTLAGLPTLCEEFKGRLIGATVCAQSDNWLGMMRLKALGRPHDTLTELQTLVFRACGQLRAEGRDWPQMPKVCPSGEKS